MEIGMHIYPHNCIANTEEYASGVVRILPPLILPRVAGKTDAFRMQLRVR